MVNFDAEEFMRNFEKQKQKRQMDNLKRMNETFQKETGQSLNDVMGYKDNEQDEQEENTKPIEKEVECNVLSRILTIEGPFDKKSHWIPEKDVKDLIRIDIDLTKHCLYRRTGKNGKGESVYMFLRTNHN